YYFNDGGRQMKLLGESLAARYQSIGPFDITPPEDGYHGEYVREWAEDLRNSRGDGLSWKEDRRLFIDYAQRRALEMITEDLDLLNISFDRFFTESELIPDRVEAAIEELSAVHTEEGGLVYSDPEDERKKWLRLTSLGRPKDRVIVREDGSYTYRMPDIAYHLDKFARGYDLIVDVFGADHLDTSRDVTAALGALLGDGEVAERLRVVIHQFVTLLKDGGRTKMSTRAGNFVTMGELVEDVGSTDVTRYLFLTRRAEAHMDFDLDLAREQSMDNPVYYVQYAHARIAGILEKAAEQGIRITEEYSGEIAEMLNGDHERELMRLLESVPMEVASASRSLEPHRITETLAKLATGFHRFYQKVRVVDSDKPRLSSARLILCEACRRSIADLLGILGVEAPEKM
ncbi:MAG: arginine--tRNA ligase, partial [Candidatus Aegiribacteria sp.]|nr:arginine--tRNA ligase [Candidatus Aegiribacteria sp.]MBD3295230.1 arginine--tRNA ligase [Candidatus Fermentibacteria bacterium]